MTCEEQIKTMAAQGHSKRHTMELLGFTRYSFDAVLELIGPITWPRQGCSVGNKAAHRLRRGRFTEGMAKAQAMAAAAHAENAKHEVRGVCGSIAELVAHFHLKIHPATVRRRLRSGATLEQALFTPPAQTNRNLGALMGKLRRPA